MENLYVRDEDKGKIFTALTLDSNEVRGELFHVNGDHFILVNGSFAVKVIPSTIKEVDGSKDKKTVVDEVKKIAEDSMEKLVDDYYQKSLTEIKTRASQGYSTASMELPYSIAEKVATILSRDGFETAFMLTHGDLLRLHLKW